MRPQRRGRSVAMTIDEINAFLADERTCRVATITASGRPHVAPLWFVWDQTHLWLYSIVKSQRWTDLTRNPNRHLAFGGGVHRCLGSHLARMELRVVLREWHKRIPEYHLAPGTELVYTPTLRQVNHVPLIFGP